MSNLYSYVASGSGPAVLPGATEATHVHVCAIYGVVNTGGTLRLRDHGVVTGPVRHEVELGAGPVEQHPGGVWSFPQGLYVEFSGTLAGKLTFVLS